MKRLSLILTAMGLSLVVSAQDYHFSQFTAVPFSANPAAAGLMHRHNDYRLFNHYKRQWGQTGAGYRTFVLSADKPFFQADFKKSYLGAGIQLISDKAGEGSLAETQLALSVAGHVKTSRMSTVSLGLKAGRVSRRLDFGALTWDSQWDGRAGYDPSLASNEQNEMLRSGYFDFGAGISWWRRDRDGNGFEAGASAQHLTAPDRSFTGYSSEKVPMLLSSYARGQVPIGKENKTNSLIPSVLTMVQGPHLEMTGGVSFRHQVVEASRYTRLRYRIAYEIGGLYRVGDAAILVLAVEKEQWRFGFSYDFNNSGLAIGTRYRGGPEVTLRYTGQLKNSRRHAL